MANPRDWYVLVKIKVPDNVHYGATVLKQVAAEVADSVHPTSYQYESVSLVMDDGFGNLVRPHWAPKYPIGG